MTDSSESDAIALWEDVADIVAARSDLPASMPAMVQKCRAVSFDDETSTITVAAGARFMKRQVEKFAPQIESCLEEAAFAPVHLVVEIGAGPSEPTIDTSSVMTPSELNAAAGDIAASSAATQAVAGAPVTAQGTMPQGMSTQYAPTQQSFSAAPTSQPMDGQPLTIAQRRERNPLIAEVTVNDSKLTFDRFVVGEENMIALQAAKRVADGDRNYNPLFVYGKSGLGKTHLLKAIQNYVIQNNVERLCVYRTAHDFVNEYATAMVNTTLEVKDAFKHNYQDIDILIIDDVQFLKGAASVGFFFDLFNYLKDHGKQIVLAADESPRMLGVSNADFDERLVSRFDSGVACPIQVPDYELKLALIRNFYQREKQDAETERLMGYEGTISEENLQLMAERAGSNIRVIESFCQACLLEAGKFQRAGRDLERNDIIKLATQKFGSSNHTVTIDEIQKALEEEFGVSHSDLVGSTRKKGVMVPRQVGCWLARNLTDVTLADIGKHFGGRSHATVYYSITETEKAMKENRLFFDQVSRLKESLLNE